MLQEKFDYSKIDVSELEIWFGKKKTELLLQLSGLEIKSYNDSVDLINFYCKEDVPYIQHNIKTNVISFNLDVIQFSYNTEQKTHPSFLRV